MIVLATSHGRTQTLAVWAIALACVGCYEGSDESVLSGSADDESGSDADDGDGGSDADDGDTEGGEGATGVGAVRRLTLAQYENSVRGLLGADIVVSPDLSDVEPRIEDDGEFKSVAAAREGYDDAAIAALFADAFQHTQVVFADAARRDALVGCTPATATDACASEFVRAFGLRAFRRPLAHDELARWLALAGDAATELDGDPWAGLQHVVAAMLQSPSLLYVVETGETDPDDPTRLRYTSWEMATRLSFALVNTAPDDLLLAAAEADELVDPEHVRAHAQRLLDSEAGRRAIVEGLFDEYLVIHALPGLGKDPAVYPKWTPQVAASMREETRRVIDWAVFDEGLSLGELLTNRTTFVDATLADIYGMDVPAGEGFQRFDIPDTWARIGLLGLGAWQSIHAKTHRTSPTLRGRFISQRLLCTPVAPPPPDVPDLEDGATDEPQTMRQKLEKHRTNPACAGCHAIMDPPGLALENFDGIGAHRENDDGLPLDVTGTIDGMAYDGPVELASVLASHPSLPGCFARQLFRYTTGSKEPVGAWTDAVVALGEANDAELRPLLVELVTSELFRTLPPQD